MERRSRTIRLAFAAARLLAWAAAVLVVSSTVFATARHHETVPFYDEWTKVDEWRDLDAGRWRALFYPHNEHLILATRVAFVLDRACGGDGGALVVLNVVCMACAALGLRALAQAGPRGPARWLLPPLAFATTFSALQIANVVNGFQLQFTSEHACTIWACALAARAPLGPSRQRAAAWALALTAPLLMASGALVAPALALLAWRRGARREALALGGASVASCALVLAVQPHRVAAGLGDAPSIAAYLFAFLGGPLTHASPVAAGVGGLLAAAPLTWRALREARTSGARAGWVALLAAALGTALLTALGRHAASTVQAVSTRYATPALLFWFALGALALTDTRRVRRVGVVLSAALLLLLALRQDNAVRAEGGVFAERRRLASTALLSGVSDRAVLRLVNPQVDDALRGAEFLRAHRLGPFAGPAHEWVGRSVTSFPADPDGARGALEALAPAEGDPGGLRVEGWAWDRAARRPPTWILLADERDRVTGLARPGERRADVRDRVPEVRSARSGFSGHARGEVLRAYALLRTGALAPLDGALRAPACTARPWPAGVAPIGSALPAHVVGAWSEAWPAIEPRLPPGPPLLASWAGDDAHEGTLSWDLPPDARATLIFATGPGAGARVALRGPGEQADWAVTLRSNRRWLALDVRAPGPGHTLTLADPGRGWGAWTASGGLWVLARER